ncbi:hypothetical protein THOD04_30356 [Vibrio owensii]|nr:hypothetical protein THOD04_30356 [Vibrio owensii]
MLGYLVHTEELLQREALFVSAPPLSRLSIYDPQLNLATIQISKCRVMAIFSYSHTVFFTLKPTGLSLIRALSCVVHKL